VGDVRRSFYGLYEEQRGNDYRFRFLPPLYLEHTRGPGTPAEDRQSLFALLYYQRRSPKADADVFFPLLWRFRNDENRLFVLGPFAHREAPGEHDNWFAPLVMEGARKNGGYFHSPLLLTSSHWNSEKAFTIAGPYFRDRTGSDVDWGIVPFAFHGDNGNTDGSRKTYTLIPPLLYYHREREIDESSLTVAGPVILRSNPKRSIFDIAPLFYHIEGKPESGGVKESHTTLFPLFHYGTSPEQTLFVTPLYLRRTTPTVDTLITPLFSHATTRNGATSLTIVGPALPIYYRSSDADTGANALGIFPFYFGSSDPTGSALLTPLYGRFEHAGVSRTQWFFPTLTVNRAIDGWETDFHPLVYLGRSEESSHTVVAPVFWDFANPKSRTTIGFPLYWRFSDQTDDSITQIAANTLYLQRRVAGGLDWQFHVLPLFSYGENPSGYWWNVLFGLAGFERSGEASTLKAFWLPIPLSGSAPPAKGAAFDDARRGPAF
jgi:hypothetical protein